MQRKRERDRNHDECYSIRPQVTLAHARADAVNGAMRRA